MNSKLLMKQTSMSQDNNTPDHPDEPRGKPKGGVTLLEKSEVKAKKPPRYAVILINDDYTPQMFVVIVLQQVFHKNRTESERIMYTAHTKGRAVIDIFTYDVARTKVGQVRRLAESEGHPLECRIEAIEEGESK